MWEISQHNNPTLHLTFQDPLPLFLCLIITNEIFIVTTLMVFKNQVNLNTKNFTNPNQDITIFVGYNNNMSVENLSQEGAKL